MILRHSQDRTGPGQPSGAQQRRPGCPTSVHAVSFGAGPISHWHVSTEVTYERWHRVTLRGAAASGLKRQDVAHSFAKHVDRSAWRPPRSWGSARGAQPASAFVAQVSTSEMTPPHVSPKQHASTAALHRAATHRPHSDSMPANLQCAPPGSANGSARMHADATAPRPTMTIRARRLMPPCPAAIWR